MELKKIFTKSLLTKVVLTTALLLGVLFHGNRVQAYTTDGVSNLEQTNMTTTSASIKWNGISNATGYQIVLNNSTLATVSGTSYTINNLELGSSQYVYVYPVNATGERGWLFKSVQVKTTPKNVANFQIDNKWLNIKSFRLSWDVAKPAPDKYEVSIYNGKNKLVSSSSLGGGSAAAGYLYVDNFKEGESYTYKIRAYNELGTKKYYSNYSTVGFIPQFKVTKAKVSNKRLQVAWKKVSGATSYDIYVSNSPKSGYKKVKTVGKNTTKFNLAKFKNKAINKNKNYYVRVVAKRKIGSKMVSSEKYYYRGNKVGLKRF